MKIQDTRRRRRKGGPGYQGASASALPLHWWGHVGSKAQQERRTVIFPAHRAVIHVRCKALTQWDSGTNSSIQTISRRCC
jgi:hypothetical protein